MRILFFLPNVRSYRDRVRLLMEVSQGLDLLVLVVGKADEPIDSDDYPNFRLVHATFRSGLRPYNILRASMLAHQLVKIHRIDVVHDTFGNLLPLLLAKGRYPGVRFVESFYSMLSGWRLRHHWRDVPTWRLLRHRATAKMFVNSLWENLACRVADHIVLQAPGLLDHLVQHKQVTPSRIHVLPNNVDVEYWRALAPRTEPTAENRDVRMLFIGGIDRTRGAFSLLDLIRTLSARASNASITMVGPLGPVDGEAVVQQAKTPELYGRVQLLGRLSKAEVREAFSRHDLFVYQTINDGSPRVVLEALAMGIPVIASHHPGIDVLDPHGDFVHFTEFGDVARMADLVEEFRSDPRRWIERAMRGAEHVRRHFSSGAVAGRYVDFYRRITEAHAGAPADVPTLGVSSE